MCPHKSGMNSSQIRTKLKWDSADQFECIRAWPKCRLSQTNTVMLCILLNSSPWVCTNCPVNFYAYKNCIWFINKLYVDEHYIFISVSKNHGGICYGYKDSLLTKYFWYISFIHSKKTFLSYIPWVCFQWTINRSTTWQDYAIIKFKLSIPSY